MATGKVKWFNLSKGFGFIEPDDNSTDVFLHISAVQAANLSNISDGQAISYEIAMEKGKSSAANIKLI
jgi:CspA family cold shock protein